MEDIDGFAEQVVQSSVKILQQWVEDYELLYAYGEAPIPPYLLRNAASSILDLEAWSKESKRGATHEPLCRFVRECIKRHEEDVLLTVLHILCEARDKKLRSLGRRASEELEELPLGIREIKAGLLLVRTVNTEKANALEKKLNEVRADLQQRLAWAKERCES